MVPVAAVGLTQVVNKLTESSPSVLVEKPSEPEEIIPEIPVIEEPDEEPVVIPIPSSGGGSPEIAAAPEPVLAFQGRVVDGYVVGATVFYDENNNGILDDSESGYVGVTDADGNFQLRILVLLLREVLLLFYPEEWIQIRVIRLGQCRLMYQKMQMETLY